MISEVRTAFNANFTPERYAAFMEYVNGTYGIGPTFRLCETPIFLDQELKDKLLEACEQISDVLVRPDFLKLTQRAFSTPDLIVPREDSKSRFIQMDFGICADESGNIIPQLIELQGFPSLYFFQDLLTDGFRHAHEIDERYQSYFGGISRDSYRETMRRIIVGNCDPKEVVMLEIEPETQNTYIDFVVTSALLGIKVLCLSKLKKSGRRLYYVDMDGNQVDVKRIYNRIIFDELQQHSDLNREFSFTDDVDAEWVGHPNWFYRISKYTLPLLRSKYVPECYYLSELTEYPSDLENWVLKPLFSFAGSGVNLHPNMADIMAVKHPDQYLLQRKVSYAPIVETPTGPAKFEVRMMMVWEEHEARPKVINNLVRVSKGEMIGVKYNKDKDWVGASVALFPV